MQILNALYQSPPKNVKFINRKFEIAAPKTLIKGGVGSGKTSLMAGFLSAFESKEFLYINLGDLRIDADEILSNLPEFLRQNPQIKILAIDDFEQRFWDKFEPILELNLQNFIVASQFKDANLNGFSELNLDFLDYEEFIAFFSKKIDPETLFSHFLLHGRSPASAFGDAENVAANLQIALKSSLSATQLAVLKECAKAQAQNVSVFEIFSTLKSARKISKDSVYGALSELENMSAVSLVEKFNEPNAAKRLYFNDFAFKSALSLKKDFTKNFNNTVFCELLKFKDEIYYTKEIDFFLNKRKIAIICVPFSAPEIIFLKFKKLHVSLKELGVSKLQIISVANQAELSFEGIKCEILPFSRWSLGL